MDFAAQIYMGKNRKKIIFDHYGHIYGPIRISAERESPEFKKFVEPICKTDFIKDKIAIFMIRDPRDILVSSYYSFGFSHGFSSVQKIKDIQKERRRIIQSKTIDEYALENSDRILTNFNTLNKLIKDCNQSVLLKYEDLIENWEIFVKDLTKHIDIKESVLSNIYAKSRPRERNDLNSHRRSGAIEGFRKELNNETIGFLNEILKPIINQFGYRE